MENNYEKIANITIQISKECPEEYKEIIQLYWEFEGTEIAHKPAFIKNKYNLTQVELTRLINAYSTASLYLYCENCVSYEKQIVTSYTSFKQILSKSENRYSQSYECDFCKELTKDRLRREQEHKHNELVKKLRTAIHNENWKKLSNFEKELLSYCLEKDFDQVKKHYGKILGQSQFIKLIRALGNIENQDLLVLERDFRNNYVIGYQYLKEITEYQSEILFREEKPVRSINLNAVGNTIKLKLTINEEQHHPDSPMFSGVVNFKEKIVIEPDVEYVFGHWQRANDNLYLTLTPKEDLEKLPEQKQLSELPISIQKGVRDFLSNLGNNLDF